VTFDYGGVSGHCNHCCIPAALTSLANVYHLRTVNVVRKYIGIFDLGVAFATRERGLIFTPTLRGHWAMLQHRSQLLWFRYLYLLASRYMVLNTLEPQ